MATDKTSSKSKSEKKAEPAIEETSLETQQPPGALAEIDYGDDEGAGYEHQTAADVSIPFIIMLQSGNPQVKERIHPLALDGNMMNTVTEEYFDRDQGFLFVPATTRHVYTKWVPRDAGGGFRGHLEPDDSRVAQAIKDSTKFGKYQITEGDELLQLTECFYVYGATCDENGGATGMAVLACTSSKITPYKKWNSRLRALSIPRKGLPPVRPPLYGNLTRVFGQLEKNVHGLFFVFGFKPGDNRGLMQSLLLRTDERFLMAKACKELVDSGTAKVDYSRQGPPEEEGSPKVPF